MPRITDRSARLNVRLDAKTRASVERLASLDGRTLSQTVRTLLRTGLLHYHGIGRHARQPEDHAIAAATELDRYEFRNT